jgi:hypothetical protein
MSGHFSNSLLEEAKKIARQIKNNSLKGCVDLPVGESAEPLAVSEDPNLLNVIEMFQLEDGSPFYIGSKKK